MSSTKKIALIAVICLAAFLVARAGFGLVDTWVLAPLADNLKMPWLAKVPSFWVFVGLLIVLPGKWTAIPVRIQIRGDIDIAATPEDIWHVIGPFAHDPYWSAGIDRTTTVPGEPDRLDFHFDDGPHGPSFPVMKAVIDAEVEGEYFAYRYLNADQMPLMGADLDLSEYFLEPIEGGTRVTQIEHLARLRLSTIPMSLFLNASQDALVRLKAVMEGQEDTSWMGRTARELAEDP